MCEHSEEHNGTEKPNGLVTVEKHQYPPISCAGVVRVLHDNRDDLIQMFAVCLLITSHMFVQLLSLDWEIGFWLIIDDGQVKQRDFVNTCRGVRIQSSRATMQSGFLSYQAENGWTPNLV